MEIMQYTVNAPVTEFENYLWSEEKSPATVEKYVRDAGAFCKYLKDRPLCKEEVIAYKRHLIQRYAAASVNSMLVSLNCYLRFIKAEGCCVKLLKIQRQMFCQEDKLLTNAEYKRLVKAADSTRLSLVIQTICGTGIRVSELRYITVEAVKAGKASVDCKNKTRVIFIPSRLKKLLKEYAGRAGIKTGPVFITKSKKPLNRSNIWREMKALCGRAGVPASKVFPHNLRHLFARTFYSLEKDIVRLADLLGHSTVNTTRIYTAETGENHLSRLERVQKMLAT